MRNTRVFNIVAIVAILAVGAACTVREDGDDPKAKLGSDKAIRVGAKHGPIGRRLPDAATRPPGANLADAKVDKDRVVRLGDTAAREGHYAVAATFYDRAVRFAPRDIAIHRKLGFALFKARQLARAKAVFKAALAIRPDAPVLLRGLGNTLLVQGETQAAIAVYRKALKASPRGRADHRLYNSLGVALDQTGAHRAAQQAYRRGLARTPGEASIRNNYALSRAAEGDYAGAIRMLEKLVREKRANARYRGNLAHVRDMAAKAGHRKTGRRASHRAIRHADRATGRRTGRRVARAVGRPRRLVPDALPDIKKLAARQGRDAPAAAGKKSAAADRERAGADTPAGVNSPAERALLARLKPGAARPAPAPPKTTTQAAAVNRLAPAAGRPDRADRKPDREADPLDDAEAADRLFLRVLHGRAAPKKTRRK